MDNITPDPWDDPMMQPPRTVTGKQPAQPGNEAANLRHDANKHDAPIAPLDERTVEAAFADLAEAETFASTASGRLKVWHVVVAFLVLAALPAIIAFILK